MEKKPKKERLRNDIFISEISISHIDLQNQKVAEFIEGSIGLFKDRLHYKIKFYADTTKDADDESLGWIEEYQDMEYVNKKIRNQCFIEGAY